MQCESFCAHIAGFIESLAGADHAGKVRKRNTVVTARLFMDQGDVLSHFQYVLCFWQRGPLAHFLSRLLQLQTRLLFDASECSRRDISPRVRHRHPPRFGRMLELDMTSFLGDLHPAVRLQSGDYVLRIHEYLYTLGRATSSV